MSRKTAAQKAKAAAAAAVAAPEANPRAAKQTQHQEDGRQAKKIKLSHDDHSTSGEATHSNHVETTAVASGATRRQPGHPRPPAPAPPASIPSSTLILPPEADDSKLRSQCDLHTISVTGSSKMESKIQQTLQALQSPSSEGKSVLVALTASSRAANKCIGVAEIAKREIWKLKGEKSYQYTGCWTRLETLVPKARMEEVMEVENGEKAGVGSENGEDGGEEDDDAFDDAATTERKHVRTASCLVVYLASRPVPRLRERYGEQVHEGDKG